MSLYIIAYDLNNPGKDYTKLFQSIESLGDALHIQKSVWLLKTDNNADSIVNFLRENMNDNDILFVSELNKNNYQGWMNRTYWEWLKNE